MAVSRLDAACFSRHAALLNPLSPSCALKLQTASFSAIPSALPLTQVPSLHCTFLGTGVLRLSAEARGRSAVLRSRQVMAALLPENFGYVALTIVASGFLLQWQAIQVAGQRRKYKVKYPRMYEDAENSVFNCYQRAHQNTLESYPIFLTLLLVSGLGYPIISSILGAVWIVGRVVFSLGYYTGDPQNRLKGNFHYFALIGLVVATIAFAFQNISFRKLL